jgi:hypothetical protein
VTNAFFSAGRLEQGLLILFDSHCEELESACSDPAASPWKESENGHRSGLELRHVAIG